MKVLPNSKASRWENLYVHFSSNYLRCSAEGLLLGFFLLAEGFGVLGDSLRLDFFAGVVFLSFFYLTRHTSACRVHEIGVELVAADFFLVCPCMLGLLTGVTGQGRNPYLIPQSFIKMQGSSPTPLSLHRAHLEWPSKPAIMCLQLPRFCPGYDMVIDNKVELLKSSK